MNFGFDLCCFRSDRISFTVCIIQIFDLFNSGISHTELFLTKKYLVKIRHYSITTCRETYSFFKNSFKSTTMGIFFCLQIELD